MPDGGNGAGRSALTERLAALRARHRDATTPEAVAEIVEQVLATMHGDLTANEATLLAEVEQIGRTIAAAKQEIASLQVEDINRAFIPSATDELDAIVEATAQATNEILDCCETFEKVSGELGGEKGEALQAAVTRIYEACSFQDITGQRITKVVRTLKSIEDRIAAIVATFSDRAAGAGDIGHLDALGDAGGGQRLLHRGLPGRVDELGRRGVLRQHVREGQRLHDPARPDHGQRGQRGVRRQRSVLGACFDTAHVAGQPYGQGLRVGTRQEEREQVLVPRQDEHQNRQRG